MGLCKGIIQWKTSQQFNLLACLAFGGQMPVTVDMGIT